MPTRRKQEGFEVRVRKAHRGEEERFVVDSVESLRSGRILWMNIMLSAFRRNYCRWKQRITIDQESASESAGSVKTCDEL